MLAAIAIALVAMPFAYRQVSNLGDEMRMLSAAKHIAQSAGPVRNFMRLYSGDFSDGDFVQVDIDGENTNLYISRLSGETVAFLVDQNFREKVLWAHKIAGLVGADSAVVEADGVAYSPHGNWAIAIPDGVAGDIVYRIRAAKANDGAAKYLHRTVLSEGEFSTMKRDLSMGGFSVSGAGAAIADKLTAPLVDAYLAKAGAIVAGALYFTGGLNLNPEKAKIPNMRVSGDVVGFRNLVSDNFNASGALTAERAAVAQKLVVAKKFEVKSPYARSVAGFEGVSASGVCVAYLDVETLMFMPGFGLVVSGELLHGATPPIRIGNWSFPNSGGAGPKISGLRLSNFGGQKIEIKVPDFGDILKEGWK